MRTTRTALVVSGLVALARAASADVEPDAARHAREERYELGDTEVTASPRRPRVRRHLVYAELRGKAGTYGLGYEYAVSSWLSLGAGGSYHNVGDTRRTTLVPYLHGTLLRRGEHALFAELGLMYQRTDPVVDRMATTTHDLSGMASLGFEHTRESVVFRFTGSVLAGSNGPNPMIGLSIGVRR